MISKDSLSLKPQRDWSMTIDEYPDPKKDLSFETHGSKNCALPVMMYCFLMEGNREISVDNIPNISDVHDVLEAFRIMGGVAEYSPEKQQLHVSSGITSDQIPTEFIQKTRISVLLMSIILVRFGKVEFPKEVGGCKLGDRNYDYHLNAFKALGCTVTETDESYVIIRSNTNVRNPVVTFPQASTTGTENALFLANFANQDVLIKDAHLRPEITELIRFMNMLGSNIEFGNDSILVHPAGPSWQQQEDFHIIDDLEEALSKLALACITGSSATVQFNNNYQYQEIDTMVHLSLGEVTRNGSVLQQRPSSDRKKHSHVSIETAPYPGIGSDSQPIIAGYLLDRADSFSIKDTRFASRFAYAKYLEAFEAKVAVNSNTLNVSSIPHPETGADNGDHVNLVSYDLRSAMNAILSSAFFRRRVKIDKAGLLQRGYADILQTLDQLGFNYSITK